MTRSDDFAAVSTRLAAALAGTSSLEKGLRLCLAAALQASGLDAGGIYLFDPAARKLRLAATLGVGAAFRRSQREHGPGVPYYDAVMRGRPAIFDSRRALAASGPPRGGAVRREGLKAAVIIPILARGRLVASLNLASHHRDSLPASSLRAAQAIAAQIGLALMRLRAETSVRQSEARYRRLFKDAGNAIFLADAKTGLIRDANDKAAELTGYSIRELRGMHQAEIHPPAETARYRRLFQTRLSRGFSRPTFGLLRRRDGRDVPVEISSSLVTWEGRRMLLGFFRDMTEREREDRRRARSRDQLRRMASRLAESQENERRRIARELHDGVGQEMAALALILNKLKQDMPDGHLTRTGGRLDESISRVSELTSRIREVIADLRPPLLDDYGLSATLEWIAGEFTRKQGVPVKTWIEEDIPRLPPLAEIALVRIAGEALTNVARHARARQVVLALEADEAAVRLEIKDDGAGFALDKARREAAGSHWGLSIMKERAEGAGGRFHVLSGPGQGTRILVEVPR